MESIRTIILIAHGSRASESNQEVILLAKQLAEKCKQKVIPAFLDKVAQPNIPEVIDQEINSGSTHITCLPYFLNSGNHVQQDIPEIIAEKMKQYPKVSFELKPHFGSNKSIVDLLANLL